MILSEKEAMERWCPFARIAYAMDAGEFSPTFNPWVDIDTPDSTDAAIDGSQGTLCIGSMCMAWRTVQLPFKDKRGYCGLAGVPPQGT